MTTGGSPGRSPPGAPAGAPAAGRPDRPPLDLPRPVGRSARAIPGPLPRLAPPPRGGATTPSRALPWPRRAAAWRRSPVVHPGSARPAPPRRLHPGIPVSDPWQARHRPLAGASASGPLPVLPRSPPPSAIPPPPDLRSPLLSASPRWRLPRNLLRPPLTGRRPGPMTTPSPCSAGNAPPPPRVPRPRRRIFWLRPRLPRAGPCPAPPGAARRLPNQSGNPSPLKPCPFLPFCTSA